MQAILDPTTESFMPTHVAIAVGRAYREAVDVQNASNLSGVVHSYARAFDQMRADLGFAPSAMTAEINVSTNLLNRHPVAVLFASKVHDLPGLGLSSSTRFGLAYQFALSVAGGQYMIGSLAYYEALAAYFRDYSAAID